MSKPASPVRRAARSATGFPVLRARPHQHDLATGLAFGSGTIRWRRTTPRRDALVAGYRGHVDTVEPMLSGWVSEAASPDRPVKFYLSIDRSRPVRVIADRPRADVAAAGLGGPNCGFSVDLPARLLDGAEHEFTLLLPDGRRLSLPGRPARVVLGPVRADLVRADEASVAAVADLLRQTHFEAGLDPDLIGIADARAFNALDWADHGFLFYARVGTRLVGYGRLDRGRGDARVLGVVALTVLEAYRRKGLGEGLLRTLLSAAVAAGLRQVWLSVRPDNTPAICLYEKLGFVRNANRPAGRWAIPGEMTMVWLPHLAALVLGLGRFGRSAPER